jgi:hypothetical protein
MNLEATGEFFFHSSPMRWHCNIRRLKGDAFFLFIWSSSLAVSRKRKTNKEFGK